MNSFKALIMGAVIALAGCATVGVPVAETTSEKIVFAYKAVATAADTIGILFDAGKVDREEARAFHTRLTQSKQGIDTVVQLRDAGDFSNAETRLAAIISALTILQSELDAKKGEQ
jgi:hypothetical protein